MYQTINKCDFHDAFRIMDRLENFSYEGRSALFDYLTEIEESDGKPIELDVIALCCEFSEDRIENVLKEYNLETFEDLEDETLILWHDNERVLYKNY